MGQYCDSKALETAWFNWLLASATPELELYRTHDLLYTKIIGTITVNGVNYPNPLHPIRSHCLVSQRPVYMNSYNGKPGKPRVFEGSRPVTIDIPTIDQLRPDSIATQRAINSGYRQERPERSSWDYLVTEISRICGGIASKFNLPGEDARADLAGDALTQVIMKIRAHRLVYTPGRAPVFNLLTTTIHRIIFSILNREAKLKQNAAKNIALLKGYAANSHKRPHGRRIVTIRRYGSLVACPR